MTEKEEIEKKHYDDITFLNSEGRRLIEVSRHCIVGGNCYNCTGAYDCLLSSFRWHGTKKNDSA